MPLPFRLSPRKPNGQQKRLTFQLDTAGLSPGRYRLLISQAGDVQQDFPLDIHPPLPQAHQPSPKSQPRRSEPTTPSEGHPSGAHQPARECQRQMGTGPNPARKAAPQTEESHGLSGGNRSRRRPLADQADGTGAGSTDHARAGCPGCRTPPNNPGSRNIFPSGNRVGVAQRRDPGGPAGGASLSGWSTLVPRLHWYWDVMAESDFNRC